MISGNSNVRIFEYSSLEDLANIFKNNLPHLS
jgi:hypothetical protein